MAWRLIYDSDTVYNLGEIGFNEKVYTNKTLFIGETLYDCFDEIDKQQLNSVYLTGDTQVIIFSSGTRQTLEIDVYLSGGT